MFFRKIGLIKSKKYLKIKQFENKHSNERCFIVCTGPSLTFDDLEKIKHEICFGMNSIVKVFDETKWRPIYYGIQDFGAYEKLEPFIINAINTKDLTNVFVGVGRDSFDFGIPAKLLPKESNIYLFLCIIHYTFYNRKIKSFHIKFSDDAYEGVYDGATITYSIIQIAVYMGFKEIYLLGCDCDYLGEQMHFAECDNVEKNIYFKDKKDAVYDTNRMTKSYQAARKYADAHGIKIYNATRGGKLEVFERVNLDEVLRQTEGE